MSDLPIKPLSDIEVKAEVSESDKILILDSDTNEARLADKEELRGASIVTASFSGDDIVFGKDDSTNVTLANAKTTLHGDTGASITSASFVGDDIVFGKDDSTDVTLVNAKNTLQGPQGYPGATGNGVASITSSKVGKTTTVTITETNGTVDSFQIQDGADGTGVGDMTKSVYDPNGLNADAFDYNNFINTPTVNTRQFILSSLNDLVTAQSAYEYAVGGDGVVIRYNNEDYFLSGFDNGDPIFLRTKLESATSNDGTNTYMKDTGLKFTIVSANVTAISVVNNTNPGYLATGVNYATPYTPEYNGSPATKKYVDDGLGNKQDTISDLETIRSGASAGATAVQPGSLGTAATKNTGTSAGNVPVLDVNGKIDSSVLPAMSASLSTLTDTTITTPTNGQIVQYNGTSQKWENTTANFGHDYSWETLTGTTLTITGQHYRNQISTNANITVSVGTGLTPGMEYILRVVNTDTSNAITMTYGGVVYTIPESANINFKFYALTSTTLDFEGPRILTQMITSNVEEGKIYYII